MLTKIQTQQINKLARKQGLKYLYLFGSQARGEVKPLSDFDFAVKFEVFEILGKQKIIPAKLAGNFSNLAKFRNILVHDYVDVDLQKIYNYLQNDLGDFEKFIMALAKFLKKY